MWLREEVELRAVDLKAVDLLVMKCMGAYDGIGAEEFSACTAQAVSQELMVRAGMSWWKRWRRSRCVSVSE
jgi:hypothetical protein